MSDINSTSYPAYKTSLTVLQTWRKLSISPQKVFRHCINCGVNRFDDEQWFDLNEDPVRAGDNTCICSSQDCHKEWCTRICRDVGLSELLCVKE